LLLFYRFRDSLSTFSGENTKKNHKNFTPTAVFEEQDPLCFLRRGDHSIYGWIATPDGVFPLVIYSEFLLQNSFAK